MFARVSRFIASVEQLDEGLALVREAVAPRIGKQPGFEGLMVMMDRQTGVAYTISFWKTEEDLAGSRELGEREAETAARDFDVGVDVGNCEVVFSTVPTSADQQSLTSEPNPNLWSHGVGAHRESRSGR